MSETKEVRDATITGLLEQNRRLRQENHQYRMFVSRFLHEGAELLENSNLREQHAQENIVNAAEIAVQPDHVGVPSAAAHHLAGTSP